MISHLNNGRVKHEWEGLQVLKDGPSFTAVKGSGVAQLNIWGSSMNVELVGERVPGLPREGEVRGEGECVPVVPGMGALRRRVEVREDEEEEETDDDWTIVGDEDGAREVVKRPPPTYEDATRT